MNRIPLTPGKLYMKLSAEFRRLRSPECANCRMPMVMLTNRRSPGEPNWTVERVSQGCDHCAATVQSIVLGYAELYDLKDPLSAPLRYGMPIQPLDFRTLT